MKFKSALALLFLIFLSSPAFSQVLTAEFDKLIQETYKPSGPDAAVLVAKNGQVVYQKAFGIANLEL